MKRFGVTNGEYFQGQWQTVWFTTESQARNLYNLAHYISIKDGIRPMPSLIEEEEEVETATVEECDFDDDWEDDDWEPKYEWEDDWYEDD